MKFIALLIVLLLTPLIAQAQEVGDKTTTIAWCVDEDSAIRLGLETAKGIDEHIAFLHAPGNTCVFTGGLQYNVTVIEKVFTIGRLQFWLVLPDISDTPVYCWTLLPFEQET
jgi:hypothetical protein